MIKTCHKTTMENGIVLMRILIHLYLKNSSATVVENNGRHHSQSRAVGTPMLYGAHSVDLKGFPPWTIPTCLKGSPGNKLIRKGTQSSVIFGGNL